MCNHRVTAMCNRRVTADAPERQVLLDALRPSGRLRAKLNAFASQTVPRPCLAAHVRRCAPPRHATAMQPPCDCRATAMQPPCNRQATARQPPCNRRVTAIPRLAALVRRTDHWRLAQLMGDPRYYPPIEDIAAQIGGLLSSRELGSWLLVTDCDDAAELSVLRRLPRLVASSTLSEGEDAVASAVLDMWLGAKPPCVTAVCDRRRRRRARHVARCETPSLRPSTAPLSAPCNRHATAQPRSAVHAMQPPCSPQPRSAVRCPRNAARATPPPPPPRRTARRPTPPPPHTHTHTPSTPQPSAPTSSWPREAQCTPSTSLASASRRAGTWTTRVTAMCNRHV